MNMNGTNTKGKEGMEMIKVVLFDGSCRFCSVIEFTWDGEQLILDEGKEHLDPMEVVRIVTL